MPNRRFNAAVALALFSVFAVTDPLWGQDDETPCERFGAADVTFVGRAGTPTRRWFRLDPDFPDEEFSVVPVVVERPFRGVTSAVVYLQSYEPDLPESALEEGRSYLVYGEKIGAPQDFIRSLPHVPRTTKQAAADLEFLETTASGTGATIYGVLAMGSPVGPPESRTPLARVPIRFWSESGFATEIFTDEDGRFRVSSLPDGLIEMEPSLPPGLAIRPTGVYVHSGGCSRQHLVVRLSGRISGRVVRNDDRMFDWLVDLIPLDPRQAALSTRSTRVRVDKAGNFEFSGQPPGKYLLGVNVLQSPSPSIPYKPTYYPGTTDQTAAVPITIGQGTVQNGLELTLTEKIPPGKLEVRLENDDSPGDTTVCFGAVSSGFGESRGVYPVTPDKPLVIDVLEGIRYQLSAHVGRQSDHAESAIVEVVGAAERRVVTLTVTPSTRPHHRLDRCP